FPHPCAREACCEDERCPRIPSGQMRRQAYAPAAGDSSPRNLSPIKALATIIVASSLHSSFSKEEPMQTRPLGTTGIEVSRLCLGTMTFGEQNSEAEAHEQLDRAVSFGIDFIDTAEMYPVPP